MAEWFAETFVSILLDVAFQNPKTSREFGSTPVLQPIEISTLWTLDLSRSSRPAPQLSAVVVTASLLLGGEPGWLSVATVLADPFRN